MEQEFAVPLCLSSRGNTKVGRVWTFSLPSFLTCPGASAWCRQHCYAARFERIRGNCRRAYVRNLALSLEPERFVDSVLESLPEDAPLVRVHVGGDYYSIEYAAAWLTICETRPATSFWSYSRSWAVASLLPALDRLRALHNTHVLASVDPDMPLPPEGWRTAFIDIDPRASGVPCRHQQGQVHSCLECGYCFREDAGNVVFKVH
jgi:Gene product 88